MDKRYIFIFLLALTATAFGQNTNPRLRELELFLRQQPHGLQFTQKNDFDNSYIRCDWHAQLDTIAMSPSQLEKAINTIRTAFATLRKDATESYMYEYHQNNTDSIMYSIAFARDKFGELSKSHINNQVYFTKLFTKTIGMSPTKYRNTHNV